MGLKSSGGGEIVQVQGGHIIRATGRKDRHSKVFTAKGPRDRRVRLAAHTAIQFYDVQDRLGYDRPSKAVDWLINKAKASIDKLAELPPWDPTSVASQHHLVAANTDHNNLGSSNQISLGVDLLNNNNNINHNNNDDNNNNNTTSSQFYSVPQCVDSQSLADSMIKSFFPATNNTSCQNNSMNFQNYPHDQNTQDLCLSLHTLEDPGAAGGGGGSQPHPSHHHHHHHHHQDHFGFDAGWGQQQDIGRFTRLMGWAGDSSVVGGGEGRVGGGGGLMFNSSPQLSAQALLLSQQHVAGSTTTATPATNNYSHHQQQQHQRGTLQSSSYSPFARAFEHSDSGIGHGSADNSFMGFYIPSQIHGDLHGAAASLSNNRASSSSLSPDSSQH